MPSNPQAAQTQKSTGSGKTDTPMDSSYPNAHKGRSQLSRQEMQEAQFTPESIGPGLDHAPDAPGGRPTRTQAQARFDSPDAAPNEHVPEEHVPEENAAPGRIQRSSV